MPDRLPNGADEFNLPEPHVIPTQKAPPHGRFLILTFPCSAIRIRFHSGMPCKFILTYLAKRLIPHTPPCRKSQNKKRGKAPQSGGESEIRTRERLAPSTVFKTVAINRSAISPIIFQHTLRNSVPTTVCGSTAAPDAPCSPISASLRCQDRCNQLLSFKTTEAVLVCTQNSPKGQEFFKNYLRLPIRRR